MTVNVVAKSAVRVLPQDFALKLAMKECSDSLGKYDYYIGESYEKINGANYYYFFVDMLPEAGWEHPCKHVYINISGVTSQNPAIVKDDKRPLGNKTLKPIHVKNRYGANSKKKHHVKKNNSLSPVELKCASHTYAVILSGGINKDSNDETYWNDCSFIYQTLRHHYGVPKENMKVIMSDGKDPGLDMKTCDNEYISSPLDLDEDGVDDVEYAATKENVRKVFEDLASKLTEEDHLFLYVIDHGGIKNKKAYICLWNDETLYPDELNESLNAVNAGYISILMGQCYSGGFVEPLKADNRIIMAACGENEMSFGCEELPFDEFVYHWTSAMNEATPYGEEVYADTNGDGIVSMGEAFAYAELNDAYSMGKFFCVEENPINARKANVMYDELGFSNIPPVGYDLYISDNENDTGKRPYDPYLRTVTFPQIKIWDNMSLWTRNQNDGFTNTEMQNVTFEENDVAYLYAKITNRGTKPYVFDNENPLYLYFYWTSAAFAITTKDWKGIVDQETDDEGIDKVFGGKIGSKKIRETIAPGESCIIMREWAPDEDTVLEDIRKEPDFHACFLAGISKNRSNLAMPSGETEGMVDIMGSNKLAQKNVQVYNPHKPGVATVRLGRLFSEKDSCRLCLMNVTDKKIFENTEISLTLSPDMMTVWTEQGCSGRNINVVGTNTKRIIFKDENSSLSNIFVGRKNRDKVTFNFNKLVNSGVKTFGNQRLDFALVGKNGEILGGETFIVKEFDRQPLQTSVENTIDANGNYLLNANNAEDVKFEWYRKEGTFIGDGSSISVPANSSNTDYSLRTESVKDGAISYDDVSLRTVPKMESASMVSPKELLVKFSSLTNSGTKLRITTMGSISNSVECNVESGVSYCTVSVPKGASTTLLVNLIENGVTTESRKVISK